MSRNGEGNIRSESYAGRAGAGDDTAIGRLTLDKKFAGDLEGTSRGQMLGSDQRRKARAVTSRMEKVTGKLGGRSGSFVSAARWHDEEAERPEHERVRSCLIPARANSQASPER